MKQPRYLNCREMVTLDVDSYESINITDKNNVINATPPAQHHTAGANLWLYCY